MKLLKIILVIFSILWQFSTIEAQDYFAFQFYYLNGTTYEFRCFGGIFRKWTTIVPASCLDQAILKNESIWFGLNGYFSTGPSLLAHSIQPYFNFSDPSNYNVGRIQLRFTTPSFDSFSPRDLSRIPMVTTRCRIQSFESNTSHSIAIQTDVDVRPPSECGNDSPHTHCTFVAPAEVQNVCRFALGSPLVCDGSTIAGFVISDGGCETRDGSTILRFNSAIVFDEWMEIGMETTTVGETTTLGASSLSRLTKLGLISVAFLLVLLKF